MGSKIKDVGKVKEIPFGPQLPKDGPYKYAKGGRAGYKDGSKCKLATKGKGRAYGKNS